MLKGPLSIGGSETLLNVQAKIGSMLPSNVAVCVLSAPLGAVTTPAGSTGVLAFGLLALAILSFLIGLAGLVSVARLRTSDFPAVSRHRIRRRIGVFWGTVLANLFVVPAIGLLGFGAFVEVPPGEMFRTGLLTLMVIVLIASNYTGLSVQRALMRIKLQPGGAGEHLKRQRPRWQQMKRSLRENLISAVTVLGISILIWWLIDNQLSDDHIVSVPVTVELASEARDGWTVMETEPSSLHLIFRGPKELVQEIRHEEIEAQVRLRGDDLGGVPSRRTLEKSLSQIEFQTGSDRRWPSGISALASDPSQGQVRIRVAPNVSQDLLVQSAWLQEALDNEANEETHFSISTFEPRRVYLVYPEADEEVERLYFEPIDVQALTGTPRPGEYTVTLALRPPAWLERDALHIFRTAERRTPVERIRIEVTVHDATTEQRSFRNVEAFFALPGRCIEMGVTVSPTQRRVWDEVRLEGPRRALERIPQGELQLLWLPEESTIDYDALATGGESDALGHLKPIRKDGSPLPEVRLVRPQDLPAVILINEGGVGSD